MTWSFVQEQGMRLLLVSASIILLIINERTEYQSTVYGQGKKGCPVVCYYIVSDTCYADVL